ncbi:hypothetical protein QBC46DRAFT_415328 [Diplogelasinospora grovesii]|uniref:RGS domain-containing protein n=1 Tax=Diplogelasinospora grovesii TaxID=303347 RepID=A0AAN6NIA6_9PEZI|nr:hypothetical protein QBC46DRAFT_415328 [Diplogelasinospora grovesii]
MSDFDQLAVEQGNGSPSEKIPAELAFEEVVKNRTAPPCSLNDFMDYLLYVEHNAECLQFFLWYCDYIQRWSKLLPRQKALSPVWDPDKARRSARFITYSHKRARSDKMSKILSIMEMNQPPTQQMTDEPQEEGGSSSSRKSTSSSRSSRTSSSSSSSYASSILSPTESVKADWQPFTIQPFRDEVTRIGRHYLADSAPRQLDSRLLNSKDRQNCLQAVQHTTHPSALLPAFMATEAHLRSHSHPNFVRWSRANSNRSRIIFLRLLSTFLILTGLALDITLILSRQSHFLRILCLILWWPGSTVLLSSLRGVCVFLHFHGARQLRPWEQAFDGSDEEKGVVQVQVDVDVDIDDMEKEKEKDYGFHRQHSRKDTAASNLTTNTTVSVSSVSSRVDPLRKASLQTFGPRNDDHNSPEWSWVKLYGQKPMLQRVYEKEAETVAVQNKGIRLLQDRAVFFAILWGGVVASILTVGSLFIPAGNMFL